MEDGSALHHSTTPSLRHSATPLLRYSATPLLRHSATLALASSKTSATAIPYAAWPATIMAVRMGGSSFGLRISFIAGTSVAGPTAQTPSPKSVPSMSGGRRRLVHGIVARGVAGGELRADIDVDATARLVVWAALTMSVWPSQPALTEAFVELVLRGLVRNDAPVRDAVAALPREGEQR